MTFCLAFEVPSLEFYKAAHAEFAKFPTEEILLHIARPTDDGVQVIEVWTSAEAFQSWMAVCGGPVVGALTAAGWTVPDVTPTPFEAAGLVMPTAGIAV